MYPSVLDGVVEPGEILAEKCVCGGVGGCQLFFSQFKKESQKKICVLCGEEKKKIVLFQ